MNLLDYLLIVLVLAYALSGYWQGFITGAFATVGLLAGGLLGVFLAPRVLGDASPSLKVSLGALIIVIVLASLGQAVMQYAGAKVRSKITWRPVRSLDAIGGAALSAAAVLLVAWALGVAVQGTKIGSLTSLVRDSAVLGEVNNVLPADAPQALDRFNNVVGAGAFPRYLEPFKSERIVNVGPGAQRLLTNKRIAAAQSSILKVRGQAVCGRGVEGSGFVFAKDYLMTNAHVVAGVRDPEIVLGDGTQLQAETVYYDPDVDIAVLRFDDSSVPTLSFVSEADKQSDVTDSKAGVAIIGYPLDGPYDVERGRVRSEQNLRSPDIYGNGTVVRDVYSVRGTIRPGNSGGPLVTTKGQVAGVVFAASVTDDDTGYALTAEQVSAAASAGQQRSAEVSTGNCTAG